MPSLSNGRSPFSLFRSPEFAALAAMNVASGMAFATIIIALALYADLFEASGVVAGLFGTVYAAVRLVLVLPVGRYVDVGDAKRLLVVGMALNVLVLVAFAFVTSVQQVVALRGFQAVGSIIVYIAGTAIVGTIAAEGERGLWIGTYNQTSAFSSLAGDLLGGALLFFVGFQTTYGVLVVLSLIATAGVVAFVREQPGGAERESDDTGIETLFALLRRRAVLALVVFRFAFSFGKMSVIIFLPIYARTDFAMTALLIGAVLAGGKLTKSVAQGYVGGLADRVGGYERFIVVGTLSYALGTALIPLAPTAGLVLDPIELSLAGRETPIPPAFFTLFLAYVILGIGDSLRLPTSMALFVREGEYQEAVGGSLSLRSVSWQVGAVVGPTAFGLVLDAASFLVAFWVAAGFMLVAAAVFVVLYEEEGEPVGSAVAG